MSRALRSSPPVQPIALRKPTVADVGAIVDLLQADILAERVLPRSRRQVTECLRDYTVAELDGALVGVASVSLVDLDLAEVGVLVAADTETEGRLLDAILAEAQAMGVGRAFVLTDDAGRFEVHGFARTTLAQLPEKRDRQCLRCPRLPRCRQVALARPLEPLILRATA